MDLRYILFGVYITFLCGTTSGLRCWNCENANSANDCYARGYSQQCRPNDVCQTEIRYNEGWGDRPLIRTSCKDKHACSNNHRQNPKHASAPTQCNKGITNSVCRCCCSGYHCNRQDVRNCGRKQDNTTEPDVPKCDNLGGLRNGKIVCSNGRDQGSVCSFQCDEGYSRLPANRSTTECVSVNGEVKWSHNKPCCSSQCPPQAVKDVVFVLDSSGSITATQWVDLKEIVASIIRLFDISENAVKVAVFSFSLIPDEDSQISFGNYASKDDLITKVLNLPRNGSITNLGAALKFANDTILQDKNNRKNVGDMLFVLNDGASDDVYIDIARQMRKDGVKMSALGVFRGDRDVIKGLEAMTGDPESVIEINQFSDFSNATRDLIGEKICELSC